MSRFWIGEPLDMDVDDHHHPRAFRWRGRTHRVEQVTNRWRVDIGWWGDHIWRDYLKLTTHTGLLVIVYRDLVGGGWYMHRIYD